MKRVAAGPREGHGISPGWFFAGLGVTAALGGGAIASGVDTLAKHAAFERGEDVSSAGQAAQLRTNVLLFSCAGAGVATAAIGIFAVNWRGSPAGPKAGWWLRFGPASAELRARF